MGAVKRGTQMRNTILDTATQGFGYQLLFIKASRAAALHGLPLGPTCGPCQNNVLALKSGAQAIRFRMSFVIDSSEVDWALDRIEGCLPANVQRAR